MKFKIYGIFKIFCLVLIFDRSNKFLTTKICDNIYEASMPSNQFVNHYTNKNIDCTKVS